MRLCFTSDFHGRSSHYDALTDLLRLENPDLLILGGDMFADADGDPPDVAQAAVAARVLRERVDAWKRIVPGIAVACVMGNHDWLRTESAVRAAQDAGRLKLLVPEQAWSFQGIAFLGFSLTPPTPHWLKDYERLDQDDDDLPDFGGVLQATNDGHPGAIDAETHFRGRPSLAAELEGISAPPAPWILVAHAPPIATKLDRLPTVDDPIGSSAVRAFIESRRPLCALHGHVHESPELTGSYTDEVGGVLCVNPGQSHDRMHAVLFDTNDLRATIRHTVFR